MLRDGQKTYDGAPMQHVAGEDSHPHGEGTSLEHGLFGWVAVTFELLTYDFMQRALLAALLVGLAAPSVGVYLVQRRLALIGDGLGHAALTGVAVGLLTRHRLC